MRAALLPLLLITVACHPPYPDSGGSEGDTDTDADADADADADSDADVDNPPEELCSKPWGWLDTELSSTREEVRWVAPGNGVYLTYRLEGQVDLCEMMCSNTAWIEEWYITDTQTYTEVIQTPLRMDKGDVYYAYMHLTVPSDALPGDSEECYVATTAGEYYVVFSIAK